MGSLNFSRYCFQSGSRTGGVIALAPYFARNSATWAVVRPFVPARCSSQRVMAAWPERVTGAVAGPSAFVSRLASRTASGEVLRHPGILVPYALLVLLLVLAWLQLRAGRPSDAVWMAGLAALPVLTGTDAGITRYTLTVFPVTLALASLLDGRPRLRYAWLAGSAALLLYYSAKFVRWQFVS